MSLYYCLFNKVNIRILSRKKRDKIDYYDAAYVALSVYIVIKKITREEL